MMESDIQEFQSKLQGRNFWPSLIFQRSDEKENLLKKKKMKKMQVLFHLLSGNKTDQQRCYGPTEDLMTNS